MNKLRNLYSTRALTRVAVFGLLTGLLLSVFVSLVPRPQPASAQAEGVFAWVNAGTITAGGRVYFDSNPGDDSHWFVNNAAGTCTYEAGGRSNIPNDRILLRSLNEGTLFIVSQNIKDDRGRVTCEAPGHSVTGTGQRAANYVMYRSGDNLMRSDGTTMFSKINRKVNTEGTTNGEMFIRVGELDEPCPDVVVHGENGGYNGWYIIPAAPSKSHYSDEQNISGQYIALGLEDSGTTDCRTAYRELFEPEDADDTDINNTMRLGNSLADNDQIFLRAFNGGAWKMQFSVPDISVAGPPAGSTPPAEADGPEDQGPPTACDISFNFATAIGFKWIICPIVNIMMSTIAWLEDFLLSQLTTDTEPLKSDSPYHAVWGSFRTLALGIIIVVALVMVIFEATGVEAFSAYTVRTLFTRFGVAVLFIVLSWSILIEVVNVVNLIIEGARSLIYSPFEGHLPDGDLNGGAGLMLFLLGTGGILALGPWGLLSFVLTAALSIFITVVVLVIVHAIIYILIMTAPIAIALSVLPNTRKGYEFWKNALISMLVGLIAVAFAMPALDVIAASTYNREDAGTLEQIIALLLKFMRVFIVLFIFSRIGGALGTITGMVNDRSRGAFDRLKKFRENTMRERHQQRMEGGRVFGSEKLGGAYRRTASAKQGGLSPTRRGRANYEAYWQQQQAALQAKRLENDHGRAAGNDDANKIASQDGMNRSKFIQAYTALKDKDGNSMYSVADAEKALAEMEVGYGSRIGTKSFQATAWRALSSSNTAYAPPKDPSTVEEADAPYRDIITDAAHQVLNGTMSVADATAVIKSNKSRPDLAGMSFGTLMGQVARTAQRIQNNEEVAVTHEEIAALQDSVIDGTGHGAVIGQRRESVTGLAPRMLERVQEAINSGDNKRVQRELASLGGKYDAMAQVAPQNAVEMAEKVFGKTVKDRRGNDVTVQQLMEQHRSGLDANMERFDTSEWDNMRRDYKQQALAGNAALEAEEAARRGTNPVDPSQGALF